MGVSQGKAKKKQTGAKYRSARKKRLYERGSLPTMTRPGNRKIKASRAKGGSIKRKAMYVDTANVLDPKAKKHLKAKIIKSVQNPANRHFIRQNVITKGAVLETDKGKAKVTSRPGQHGVVDAVLVEEQKTKG